VLDHHGHAAVRLELADPSWLFLREQQPAVGRADDAVGIVGALPGDGPSCACLDDVRDPGNHNRPDASRRGRSALAGGRVAWVEDFPQKTQAEGEG
jgi:hypothetical protein